MLRQPPVFYCQLDYEHVPYPSPVGVANGNIANNGCGVCCASMLAENLLGVSFPPEESASLAKACGALEGFGTSACGRAARRTRKRRWRSCAPDAGW